MRIAILTFDGFNELDSFIAAAMINRVRTPQRLEAYVTCPTAEVTSMNGVMVRAQASLRDIPAMDAVIVASGIKTRDVASDAAIMSLLRLDPGRQVIGAQCSGTLILAKLGLLGTLPACTDTTTRPWVEEAGVRVLEAPFAAHGNVATAGGCLGSHYLAAWVIARLAGWQAAEAVLRYVAPVGEKEEWVERARRAVARYVEPAVA